MIEQLEVVLVIHTVLLGELLLEVSEGDRCKGIPGGCVQVF